MDRRVAFFGAVLCLALGTVTNQNKQVREAEDKEYVYTQFRVAAGEFPRLAWALSDGTLATDSDSSEIAVYSAAPMIEVAKRYNTLPPKMTLEFAEKNRIACEARLEEKPPSFSLYKASLRYISGNPQVLATSKPLPDAKVGYRRAPLDGEASKEVWMRLRPKSPNEPRNGVVIRQDGAAFFYSIAALYGGDKQGVSLYGIFLHSVDGHVIASDITEPNGEWCDGCAAPTFADGMDAVFFVKNMYTAPQFKYPVLLLDTSTVEGRSLSLATFTPDGKFSSHLFYEYVVSCSH
jgi:hypothetical protein